MEACPTQLLTLKQLLSTFDLATGLKVNYNKSVMLPSTFYRRNLNSWPIPSSVRLDPCLSHIRVFQ
jgi:hypothetical protein